MAVGFLSRFWKSVRGPARSNARRGGGRSRPRLEALEDRTAPAGPIGPGAFSPAATTINFDNLTGGSTIFTGDPITNQFAAQGVVFNNPDFETRANAIPIGTLAVTNSDPNLAFIFPDRHGFWGGAAR